MKRIIVSLIAIYLVFLLSACDNKNSIDIQTTTQKTEYKMSYVNDEVQSGIEDLNDFYVSANEGNPCTLTITRTIEADYVNSIYGRTEMNSDYVYNTTIEYDGSKYIVSSNNESKEFKYFDLTTLSEEQQDSSKKYYVLHNNNDSDANSLLLNEMVSSYRQLYSFDNPPSITDQEYLIIHT